MATLLLRAGAAYAAAIRAALAEAGHDDIPKNGLYVIGGLAVRAGSTPLGQIIDELGLSKQATGQLADALVSGGYLERHVDVEDRRRLTVGLTERGRAAARVLAAARRSVDAKLLARAGPTDLERTRRTLFLMGNIGRTASGVHKEGNDEHQ